MNREIRFRAWDEDSKSMIYDNFTMNSRGKVLYTQYGEIMGVLITYKLMQYTGLKDKNGTEIYEGDIIQADQSGTFLGDVFYTGFHKYWKIQEVKDIRDCFFKKYTEKIEIIGNIYESPELLEESE